VRAFGEKFAHTTDLPVAAALALVGTYLAVLLLSGNLFLSTLVAVIPSVFLILACATSDLRVSQDLARNLFFLADSLPASANCSRTDD
jgi:hypothetical protein